jgi:hypothetical protein
MSKKKFSEGLDDLFSNEPAVESQWAYATTDAPVRERRASNKNFMDDLDELFSQAMDERFDQPDPEPPTASTSSTKSKSLAAQRAPLSGLDALIRQTIDVQEINFDEASGKKRLTVAIDKTKLLQLKNIARIENSYLKDIMIQLIDEYLQEYQAKKGLI